MNHIKPLIENTIPLQSKSSGTLADARLLNLPREPGLRDANVEVREVAEDERAEPERGERAAGEEPVQVRLRAGAERSSPLACTCSA